MSVLSIRRGTGFPGWLRGYRIFVDGEEHGTVRNNSTRSVEVASGRHRVQLRLDWSTSDVVDVDVGDRGAVLACGPAVRGGWSAFSLSRPVADTIWLRPQASGAAARCA